MSLFDYLNSGSTSASSSSSANQISLALQQAAAQQGTSLSTDLASLTGTTSSTDTSSVQISTNAKLASVAAADASKDPAALASELRQTLDSQYSASGTKASDMTGFSGRGLAIIALNKDGSFSRAEVYAAKTELRNRDRQSALAFLASNSLTAASITSYTQQLDAVRKSMSAEEQQLRESDPSLH